jgi:hypothetical protein
MTERSQAKLRDEQARPFTKRGKGWIPMDAHALSTAFLTTLATAAARKYVFSEEKISLFEWENSFIFVISLLAEEASDATELYLGVQSPPPPVLVALAVAATAWLTMEDVGGLAQVAKLGLTAGSAWALASEVLAPQHAFQRHV